MLDICIRGGNITDGSGKASYKADLGIVGDTIAMIGDLNSIQAKHNINGTKLSVCPGIVDNHTHSDTAILADPRCVSQIKQGVTTQVVGLCGTSIAPTTEKVKSYLQSASEIPLDIQWTSFASFLDHVEKQKPATNVASFVGHGILKLLAMENPLNPASQNEMSAMIDILDQAMKEGAVGLSTGLEYHPGKASETYELEALCKVVAKYGGVHACHTRNRDKYSLSAVAEVIDITRNTNVKLQISHINPKYGRRDSIIEELLELIHYNNEKGYSIHFDVMPSEYNHSHAMALLPLWAHKLSPDELLAHLSHTEGQRKLKDNPTPLWRLASEDKWNRIFVFSGDKTAPYQGKSIEEISVSMKCTPWEAFCALLKMEYPHFHSVILTSNAFSLEDIHAALKSPYSSIASDVINLAEDGPLAGKCFSPNAYNWVCTFFENVLDKITFEEAIHKLTQAPALQMGILDRGLIQQGYKADIILFNKNTLKSKATFTNSLQYTEGMNTVIINGQIAYCEEENKVHSHGKVLKRKS